MDDFCYMLSVVAVGFALNFGLRAVPFVIFGSRKGALPPWVETFGNFVSPVIIAGLIVYSYSGLEWKTAWPYLAGAVTVGIHLWKRNPLASIIVGTVLYMCLLNCGCSSTRIIALDAKNPSIHVSETALYCGDERVMVEELADILESNDIPKSRTIHIQIDPGVKDLRLAKVVMAYLAHEGYRRPVLVTKQHGESFSTGKKAKRTAVAAPAAKQERKIRYKKSSE